MKLLARDAVEQIRREYPKGTRVQLISMVDPRSDMIAGLQGSVIFVDSTGTIHIAWDNGSSLGAVYGVDIIRKL